MDFFYVRLVFQKNKVLKMKFPLLVNFALLLCFSSSNVFSNNSKNDLFIYVGTYTSKESKGIYLLKMNKENGKIEILSTTGNVINPSFLAINKTKDFLYSVNEVSDYENSSSGSISSFKIDKLTKELVFINKKSSLGADPCYIAIDNTNNYVLTANYSGGNISIHPIDETGALLDAADVAQHVGSSINLKRQTKPHAHSIYLDSKNKFAYAVDLGIDKILVYSINSETGKLILRSAADIEPGSGPRHFVILPNGKFAYVINELNNKIISFNVDKNNGSLDLIDTYSTLPADFNETSYCADIHIHPNGKFLYGSNRGHNSIAVFEINEETGGLKNIGFESTQGNWPRNFVIDPDGNFLLVANQKSNNINVFKINNITGLLEFTGISETVPSPVCLIFYN